jgi:energy-coupling factor transport system substrate-specific component
MEAPTPNQQLQKVRVLALIPFGIALNLGLGTIASTLKAPLYVDAVATISITLLVGVRAGIVVGVGSFLLGGLLVNPVLPWFSATQAAIAVYTAIVARRGWLATSDDVGSSDQTPKWLRVARIIALGLLLGVVAGVLSAPVIVWLFGGLTGSGPSLIAAFLLKSGQTLFQAVLLSGLASEPLDKTIQLLLALTLVRSLPRTLKSAFGGGYLRENGLLPK